MCTGTSVLAAAGLLTGRRATTHWMWAGVLARQYPEVTIDPAPLFVQDGNVHTAAAVTSGLDLTLSFVEADHGPTMAREVARSLVTYLRRPGNQAQVSMFLTAPRPSTAWWPTSSPTSPATRTAICRPKRRPGGRV